MTTQVTASPVKQSASGRGYFWAAIGVTVLGVVLVVIQYRLKQLLVPWYLPILTTLGVALLVVSLARRRSIPRMIVLVLLTVLAGLEWLFLLALSQLPPYEGPARAGLKMPAFHTTRADGSPFTERDLQDGTSHILLFFRGRW